MTSNGSATTRVQWLKIQCANCSAQPVLAEGEATPEAASAFYEHHECDLGQWRRDSACKPHPTQWWFAGHPKEITRAKRICASCPVAAQCLEYAVARPALLGVWAATSATERAAMRRLGSRTTGAAATTKPLAQ